MCHAGGDEGGRLASTPPAGPASWPALRHVAGMAAPCALRIATALLLAARRAAVLEPDRVVVAEAARLGQRLRRGQPLEARAHQAPPDPEAVAGRQLAGA